MREFLRSLYAPSRLCDGSGLEWGIRINELMGWLIDPQARSILVFPQGQQPQLLEELKEVLPVPNLVADLRLSVGDIFGWLKL